MSTIIPTFICPSDQSNPSHLFNELNIGRAALWAVCNYAGNLGLFIPWSQTTPSFSNAGGIITMNGPASSWIQMTALADLVTAMPDGTSNTIMWGERYADCNYYTGHNATDPVWASSPWMNPNYYSSQPMFGFQNYPYANLAINPWGWGGGGPGTGGNAYYPNYTTVNYATAAKVLAGNGGPIPNSGSITGAPSGPFGLIPFQAGVDPQLCYENVLNTPHAVMIVGLGDGSVRTVSPNISIATWVYACTPNDGQPLGSDW